MVLTKIKTWTPKQYLTAVAIGLSLFVAVVIGFKGISYLKNSTNSSEEEDVSVSSPLSNNGLSSAGSEINMMEDQQGLAVSAPSAESVPEGQKQQDIPAVKEGIIVTTPVASDSQRQQTKAASGSSGQITQNQNPTPSTQQVLQSASNANIKSSQVIGDHSSQQQIISSLYGKQVQSGSPVTTSQESNTPIILSTPSTGSTTATKTNQEVTKTSPQTNVQTTTTSEAQTKPVSQASSNKAESQTVTIPNVLENISSSAVNKKVIREKFLELKNDLKNGRTAPTTTQEKTEFPHNKPVPPKTTTHVSNIKQLVLSKFTATQAKNTTTSVPKVGDPPVPQPHQVERSDLNDPLRRVNGDIRFSNIPEEPKSPSLPETPKATTVTKGTWNTKGKLPYGLTNVGNSCFFNSVLQCFASISPLIPKPTEAVSLLTTSFFEFLNEIRNGMPEKSICTKNIYMMFQGDFNMKKLFAFKEEDSNELLMLMFDNILSFLKITEVPTYSFRNCSNGHGYMESSIEKVGYIPIWESNTPITLEKAFEYYFTPETLEFFNCGECKNRRSTTKKTIFYYDPLPGIFIVSLGRFLNTDAGSHKINTPTIIPEYLAISSKEVDGSVLNQVHYRLVGMTLHAGSLAGGHYTALVRYDNDWYYANDSSVTKVSLDIIKNGIYGFATPYNLFYEKKAIP